MCRLGFAHREPIAAQNIAKSLPRTPQNLIELHVGQLHRFSDRGPGLLMQVEPLENLTVALHGQMAHEIANAFRELLMIDPLLQRE
jgi:hypothetical protein